MSNMQIIGTAVCLLVVAFAVSLVVAYVIARWLEEQ